MGVVVTRVGVGEELCGLCNRTVLQRMACQEKFPFKFCVGSSASRRVRRPRFVKNNADHGREGLGDDGMIPVTRSTAVLTHLQSLRSAKRSSGFYLFKRQTKRNFQVLCGFRSVFFGMHLARVSFFFFFQDLTSQNDAPSM